MKINNIHHLIIGNKYKITFPCYDDFDENLEPETIIVEVIKKYKSSFLLKNNDSEKWELSFSILKDCDIEEI